MVSRTSWPSQACIATTAALPKHQADPCGHLTAIGEIMIAANSGQQRTRGDRADAGLLHQAFAPRMDAMFSKDILGKINPICNNAH